MIVTDLPQPAVDEIDGAGRALAVFEMALESPLRHDTLALLLDRHHRGRAVLQVHRTVARDAVLNVLDTVVAAACGEPDLAAVVLASVRPGAAFDDPDDVDRWLEMSDAADEAGLELLEWFVIGPGGVSCPRDLIGEPPRW